LHAPRVAACCVKRKSVFLNRHRRLDMGVGLVIAHGEIVKGKSEQVFHRRVQRHGGQRARVPGQLGICLLQMIGIQVRITQGMHEITRLQTTDLRHHQRQQRIGSDVERHAQKDIAAALVQLTAQLAVCHTGKWTDPAAPPGSRH